MKEQPLVEVEAVPFLEARLVAEPEPLVHAQPFIDVPPFLEPELVMPAETETLEEPLVEAQAFAERHRLSWSQSFLHSRLSKSRPSWNQSFLCR